MVHCINGPLLAYPVSLANFFLRKIYFENNLMLKTQIFKKILELTVLNPVPGRAEAQGEQVLVALLPQFWPWYFTWLGTSFSLRLGLILLFIVLCFFMTNKTDNNRTAFPFFFGILSLSFGYLIIKL